MCDCFPGPIRCACEAFYDPRVIANETLVRAILPYLCQEVISFLDSSWVPLDSNANVLNYTILEQAITFLNFTEVTSKMSQFSSRLNCDNGAYTKNAIVAKILAGTLTYVDVFAYAGYAQRSKLIRSCMAVDSSPKSPTLGQKVPCMDDAWWGNVTYDVDYGACHTFNPCHGFPVDSTCESDDECAHYADKSLQGGACVRGLCACSRCAAGQNCKLANQLHAGNGRGVRFTANVGVDQDPLLASPSNGRWTYGLLVQVHTQHNKGDYSDAAKISPGSSAQISLAQQEFRSAHYPFTNCSLHTNVDAEVCKANCLKRAQAMACCGMRGIPDVRRGYLSSTVATDPEGAAFNLSDPRLLCDILNGSVQNCFARNVEKMASGLVCVDGARGFTSPYYGGLWQRSNWYDSRDVEDPWVVSEQEARSLAIRRQCVWSDNQDSALEARYGRPCAGDADCASSIDGVPGRCVEAFRAALARRATQRLQGQCARRRCQETAPSSHP